MIYLDDRQIKILKSLFDNEKYITSKKLSEMLNVSTRTIKKDIIVINDFLDYTSTLDKKSININDILQMNPIEIENKLLRTNYRYNIDKFLKDTML